KIDLPEARVVIDRDQVADLGLDLASVGRELGTLLGGGYVNRFNYFDRSYKVIPQIGDEDRTTVAPLLNLKIKTPSGRLVPVSTFTRIESTTAPRTLNRFQQRNAVRIFGGVKPGVTKEEGLRVLEAAAAAAAGPGVGLDYAGESRQIRLEGAALTVTLGFAVILIYLVLAAQFKSFRDPLIVLVGSVPLAISGALVFSYLDLTTINIYSQVGLITLVGLIAKNGILIVQFANTLQSQGVQPPAPFREVTEAPSPTDGPHPMTPSPVGRGGTQDGPAVSTDYWDQLGDTTLSRLIGEVQRGNLDVRAARARVSAARSDRVRSALELTPATTLSAGYARQRLSSASFPGASGVFPDQSVWNAGVDASWDLDVFGRIRHTVQAQGALVGVAEEDLRDVQVTLTAELARAYFELRGAQEQLEVARRNAENQRHTFDLTKQRLDAGRGSAFDTERAQAQLSSTLASIPAREAQVAAAQYRIGTLAARSPTEVEHELAQTAPLPSLPEVTSIGTPDAVVRSRPDV